MRIDGDRRVTDAGGRGRVNCSCGMAMSDTERFTPGNTEGGREHMYQ